MPVHDIWVFLSSFTPIVGTVSDTVQGVLGNLLFMKFYCVWWYILVFHTQVYYPCLLETKKRYCGMKYESLDQKEPEFEAKGIETVRRDGCPAVVKV